MLCRDFKTVTITLCVSLVCGSQPRTIWFKLSVKDWMGASVLNVYHSFHSVVCVCVGTVSPDPRELCGYSCVCVVASHSVSSVEGGLWEGQSYRSFSISECAGLCVCLWCVCACVRTLTHHLCITVYKLSGLGKSICLHYIWWRKKMWTNLQLVITVWNRKTVWVVHYYYWFTPT